MISHQIRAVFSYLNLISSYHILLIILEFPNDPISQILRSTYAPSVGWSSKIKKNKKSTATCKKYYYNSSDCDSEILSISIAVTETSFIYKVVVLLLHDSKSTRKSSVLTPGSSQRPQIQIHTPSYTILSILNYSCHWTILSTSKLFFFFFFV